MPNCLICVTLVQGSSRKHDSLIRAAIVPYGLMVSLQSFWASSSRSRFKCKCRCLLIPRLNELSTLWLFVELARRYPSICFNHFHNIGSPNSSFIQDNPGSMGKADPNYAYAWHLSRMIHQRVVPVSNKKAKKEQESPVELGTMLP